MQIVWGQEGGEGGGGVGANEDELLGMRKLSLALPASSKAKKKLAPNN